MPRLFIFLLVIVLPDLVYFSAAAVEGYLCDKNSNFTASDAYKSNLDTLLSTLPTNIDRSGFYNASFGRPPDRVSATALCRADIPLPDCRQCVRDAVTNLTNGVCHYRRQTVSWYRDSTCTLRYSNSDSMFGQLEISPKLCTGNADNATNPADFKDNLRRLLTVLRTNASRVGARRKFAAGSRAGADTIYALVQCSPDLSPSDCNDCLSGAGTDIPDCCGDSRGCRNLKPSCNLRYETYPFFNQVNDVDDAPSPAPGAATGQPQRQPPISVVQSQTGKKDLTKNKTIVIIVVSIAVSCLILAAVLVVFMLKRKPVKGLESLGENESSSIEALQYSFNTIKTATNDFSEDNKIGRGGFGVVYKGILPNGQEIAVKRLAHNSSQGSMEFKTEVLLLAKLLHRNLVKLLGFCLEGEEKILVYEFVPNGSLDNFIFGRTDDKSYLNWDIRMKIIWGIAKGLLYMHEDSQLKVIHRDLKASNVLLDHKLVPKIADFGLAKMFEQDETHGSTSKLAGTFGYMPPEYVRRGQFSVKSDVFSFGVLVLEIVCGMKNSSTSSEESEMNLLDFVWKNWNDETYANIVDPSIRPDSNNLTSDMLRCIQIGLLCVAENAINRPTMATVVLMLSSFSVSMQMPSQPAFIYGARQHQISSSLEDASSSEGPKILTHPGEHVSINDVSITELTPR